MAEITLDLREMNSAVEVHSCLMKALKFPFYYGKNLDALYDELTCGSWEEKLVLLLPVKPMGGMADYLPRLLRVFEDAALENPNLKFEVR